MQRITALQGMAIQSTPVAGIREVGLLQPIGMDRQFNLVFGAPRLQAVKNLGWTEIPAHVVDLDSIVIGEYSDNEFRKSSRRVSASRLLKQIVHHSLKSEQRSRHGTSRHNGHDLAMSTRIVESLPWSRLAPRPFAYIQPRLFMPLTSPVAEPTYCLLLD